MAILAAIAATGHATPTDALLSVAVGVFGVSAAGFLAEVVTHQVAYQRLPEAEEMYTMGRIALGALGPASVPIIVLAISWAGVLALDWSLWIGMALYAVTLS